MATDLVDSFKRGRGFGFRDALLEFGRLGPTAFAVCLWLARGFAIACIFCSEFAGGYDAFGFSSRDTQLTRTSGNRAAVEAILKQVSNLALITSALRAYSIKHDGTYPTSLEELKPDYTPPQMFAGGQIPRDHDGQPFDYRVSADKLSYTLCNDDLEKGGIECLEGGGN